jgi:hypothetical protein
MKKPFAPRKYGTWTQELIGAVAQTVLWAAAFATFRGLLSLLQMSEPPAATSDFFALFDPTTALVCLFVGPILATGALALRLRVTPKG